jgi:hypothetical protein
LASPRSRLKPVNPITVIWNVISVMWLVT